LDKQLNQAYAYKQSPAAFKHVYKLSWRVYEKKLKTAHGHIISCLYKLSRTVSQILMLVNKLK